jgi:hypothetical protein
LADRSVLFASRTDPPGSSDSVMKCSAHAEVSQPVNSHVVELKPQ